MSLATSAQAEAILAAHAAGHPLPEDSVSALLAFARSHGLRLTKDRVGLHDLIGAGAALRAEAPAGKAVAEGWDDILRGAWRSLHGLPAPAAAPPGSVTVLAFREAFLDAPSYGAVITAEDVDAGTRLRLPAGARHLVLAFDDLDHDDGRTPVATAGHVERALAFGRENAARGLLVHCQAGQCRSPALALAILADRMGPGREADAVDALLAIRPQSAANLLVLALADAALGRGGALEAAWGAYEAGREDLARVRFLRQVAHERFGGPTEACPGV